MRAILLLLLLSVLTRSATLAQEFSPRYQLVRMGPEVNSKLYDELAPVISTDGKKLYFVVSNQNAAAKEGGQKIWYSTLNDKGEWSKAKLAVAPLNQNKIYNGVYNILPDGSLFIRGEKSRVGIVSPSGGWTELRIKDFEKMNKGKFDGATISADARHCILYFSEVNGSQFSDLYLSNLQPDGSWSVPMKLSISSPGDEYSPFIGPDQKTIYFASERASAIHFGKADIYKSTRLDDTWTNWSPPVNLGKGVNTSATDSYFSVDANGNVFVCRMGSITDGGNYDIFLLKPRDIRIMVNVTVVNDVTKQPIVTPVDLKIKDQKTQTLKTDANGKCETRIPETDAFMVSASAPGYLPGELTMKIPRVDNDSTFRVILNLSPMVKKLYLSGTVYDKKTQQPIPSRVDISNPQSHFTPATSGGKYSQEVNSTGKYILTGSAEGYLNATDSLTLVADNESSGVKDIYLIPIEVGTTVKINNIYFDFDKTTLKPQSFVELNKVVDFLKQNPTVEIEIEGHTDSKGADEYNLNLSQGRSQSVVDYLASQGIDGSRLRARGFGETKPVDTNDTEEGRANNRRVEFTVLKK